MSIAAPSPGETLAFTAPAGSGIAGSYSSVTGVLTLTGTASAASYQAALRSVTYQNSSDTPNAARTITFTVDDGTTPSAAATKAITVRRGQRRARTGRLQLRCHRQPEHRGHR